LTRLPTKAAAIALERGLDQSGFFTHRAAIDAIADRAARVELLSG
jgi:hypothetical protein